MLNILGSDDVTEDCTYTQTKADYLCEQMTATIEALEFDTYGLTPQETALTTTGTIDLSDESYEILCITLGEDAEASVYINNELTDELSAAGTYTIPIADIDFLNVERTGSVETTLIHYNDPRTIKTLIIDGKVMNSFVADTYTYTYDGVPGNTQIPQVSAERYVDSDVIINIVQASAVPGTATINVTKADSNTVTYTINMQEYDGQSENIEYISTYLSDMDAIAASTYPNRRGADGLDERVINDQGWQFNGIEADAALVGVNADGSSIQFDKGISIHGITSYGMSHGEPELYADGSRKSDATIKQEYIGANNIEDYSRIIWNVEGYTSFHTQMSIDGLKSHPNASCTVRFYVDGSVVAQYPVHGTTGGINVDIDFPLGTETFAIQVDPENIDSIGNASDWANGDIVVFGNARLTNETAANVESTYLSDMDAIAASTYPNRRGADGLDERVINDQGWQFNGIEADAALVGVNADGSSIQFDKGISIHGITSYGMSHGEPELYADGSRKSDATIKQEYIGANNIEDYSRIIWNVEGYTSFHTQMSIDGLKSHPNASCTVRFYVDGSVVAQYPVHGTTGGINVDIDFPLGTETFAIQVDPENIDSIGNASDWANGDIVVFGNARLTNETAANVESTYLSDLKTPGHSLHYINKDTGYHEIWGYNHTGDNSADTSTVSFGKWLDMEPLVKAQVKEITLTEDEAAYRNSFISGTDGKAYIDYSSATWNIADEGYVRFRCTLGPRGGNTWSATDVDIKFYVDGQLEETYNLRRWSGAQDIDIDLTGADTFTIQMDPYGTGTKTDDFASGDIVVFGNARFDSFIQDVTPVQN